MLSLEYEDYDELFLSQKASSCVEDKEQKMRNFWEFNQRISRHNAYLWSRNRTVTTLKILIFQMMRTYLRTIIMGKYCCEQVM